MGLMVKSSRGSREVVILANDEQFQNAQRIFAPQGVLVLLIDQVRNVKRQNQEAPLEAFSRLVFGTTRVRLLAKASDASRLNQALLDLLTPLTGDKESIARALFVSMSVDPVSQLNRIFLETIASRHA